MAEEKKNTPVRIVILGAGFAGIYAYLKLHDLFHDTSEKEIILISERDLFTFVPMIHEVATGTLLPFSIVQSLRALPQCCLNRFIEGNVLTLNLDKKEIMVRHLNPEAPPPGEGVTPAMEERIPFDYCISALGSDTNFFGVPGAEEHALTLKDLDDARRIKNRIIESFEQAQITTNEAERRRLLRFIIVGGGPTGVELAGEISDLVHGELHKAFPLLHPLVEIRLYEGGPCLVKSMDEWFSRRSQAILASKKRVQIFCERLITAITTEGIEMGNEWVPAGTIIWTAGVKARDALITAQKNIPRDASGRIKVNEYLQISTYPFVFVVGDQAWIESKESGQPYPMRAQFAVREGETAAENIQRLVVQKKPLKEFFWNDLGFIISLGKGTALARVAGVRVSGPLAWVLYRGAYLMKIVGARAKLRTALEWTLNTFLPRDISKL